MKKNLTFYPLFYAVLASMFFADCDTAGYGPTHRRYHVLRQGENDVWLHDIAGQEEDGSYFPLVQIFNGCRRRIYGIYLDSDRKHLIADITPGQTKVIYRKVGKREFGTESLVARSGKFEIKSNPLHFGSANRTNSVAEKIPGRNGFYSYWELTDDGF